MFGGSGGCRDLSIYDKCDEFDGSYTDLGKGYKKVNNIAYLDKGNPNFRVAELEVYRIEWPKSETQKSILYFQS